MDNEQNIPKKGFRLSLRTIAIGLVAIIVLLLFFSVLNNENIRRTLKEYKSDMQDLRQQRDSIQRDRKMISDSLAELGTTLEDLRAWNDMLDEDMRRSQQKINQIRKEYEKLIRYDTYNADSVRRYFAAEYGKKN